MSEPAGDQRCPCGGTDFENGFIETLGQNGVRWMSGTVRLGLFGGARKRGRARHVVEARACGACGRLELFRGARTD